VGLVGEAGVGGQAGERGAFRGRGVPRGPVHASDAAQQCGGKPELVEAAAVHLPRGQTQQPGDLSDGGVGEYQPGQAGGDPVRGPSGADSGEGCCDQQVHPLDIAARTGGVRRQLGHRLRPPHGGQRCTGVLPPPQ
jgi:hypothetical protein